MDNEKHVLTRFGEKGLRMFKLINGERTTEQIMNKARSYEDFVINMFEYLEQKNMIKFK